MGNCIGVGRKKKRNKGPDQHERHRPHARIHKWLEENERYASDKESQSHYSVDELRTSSLARQSHTSRSSLCAVEARVACTTELPAATSPSRVPHLPSSSVLPSIPISTSIPLSASLRVEDRHSCYFTASESASETSEATANRADLDRSRRSIVENAEGASLRILPEEDGEFCDSTEADAYLTTEEEGLSPSVERVSGVGRDDEDERERTLEREDLAESEMDTTQEQTPPIEEVKDTPRTEQTPCDHPDQDRDANPVVEAPPVHLHTHYGNPFSVTPPRSEHGFHGDVVSDNVLEEETERTREEELRKLPYEKRPLRPMPTPIRNLMLSPSKLERMVDAKGRIRTQNSKVREMLDRTRGDISVVHS